MSVGKMAMDTVLGVGTWTVSTSLAVGAALGVEYYVDLALAAVHVGIRGGAGGFAAAGLASAPRPAQPIVLYEYSGCPFCKKVRETVSALALDVVVYPTPRVTMKAYGVLEGSRYRPTVKEAGGKAAFPYMVDPNTDTAMYESSDIVEYLWTHYGPQTPGTPRPWFATGGGWNMAGLFASSLLRAQPRMGLLRTPSTLPEAPLQYWGYEGGAECRMVHEVLCTLELPYTYHNAPPGALAQRAVLAEAADPAPALPYLVDPNTGAAVSGAAAITAHLRETYQAGEVTAESLADYSTKGAGAEHGTIYDAKVKKAQ